MSATNAHRSAGVSLELPPNFRLAPELTGTEVVLAAVMEPWSWDERQRPRVLMGVSPLTPERATVPQLATRAVAEEIARGAHVATVDIWPVPGGEDGRRIISLWPASETTMIRLQYISIRGGRALALSCDCDASNLPAGESLFRRTVGTIQVDFDDPPVEADHAAMPRLDPYLRDTDALEDLGSIREAQPFRTGATPLSPEELDALRRGKLRGVERGGLEAAGLVDARGRLTETGEAAREALSAPARTVLAETIGDGRPGTARLQLFQRHTSSVVLATAPSGSSTAVAGAQTLEVIASQTSPIVLARWLGLAPAWAVAVADAEPPTVQIDAELLYARLGSPETPPPPEAGRGLRWAWQQPWELTAVSTRVPAPFSAEVISVGRAGYLRLERDQSGDRVSLTTFPAEHYLRLLLRFGGFELSRR